MSLALTFLPKMIICDSVAQKVSSHPDVLLFTKPPALEKKGGPEDPHPGSQVLMQQGARQRSALGLCFFLRPLWGDGTSEIMAKGSQYRGLLAGSWAATVPLIMFELLLPLLWSWLLRGAGGLPGGGGPGLASWPCSQIQ